MRPLLAKIFPAFITDYLSRYGTFRGSDNYTSGAGNPSKSRSRPRSTVICPQTGHLETGSQLRQYEQMGSDLEGGGGHERRHSEKTIEMVTIDNASSTAELTERAKETSDNESYYPRTI